MLSSKVLKISLSLFAIALLILAVAFSIKYFFFTSSENLQPEITTNSNLNTANKINNISINIPNPAQNNKIEKDAYLQKQADSLLNLFDKMPQVLVLLKDEPILKVGNEIEKGLAYTTCEPKNKPTIFIKKAFYEKNNQKQIVNILKHELTHAYFCRQGVQVGHDERWRKKFESIGGFGN